MSLPGLRPAPSIASIAPSAMSSLWANSRSIGLPDFRKASMTSLPFARVNSPVWDCVILNFGIALSASVKPCLRSIAGARAGRALQLGDVDLALGVGELLEDPLAGELALLDEVRAEEGLVERRVLRVDGAVGEDHGDLRALGLVEDRVPARLDDRRERDHVDALLDVGADRLDLVLLLLLRVGELERDAGLLGRVLDRLRVRRAPAALGADLREPERDRLARGSARGALAVVVAASGDGQHRDGHGRGDVPASHHAALLP